MESETSLEAHFPQLWDATDPDGNVCVYHPPVSHEIKKGPDVSKIFRSSSMTQLEVVEDVQTASIHLE